MKINVPMEFEVFNDGILSISAASGGSSAPAKFPRIPYKKCTLGFKRVFAARSARVEINAVVRIPMLAGIDTHDHVKMQNKNLYILLIAEKKETNPPCLELTLSEKEGMLDFYEL